MIIHDDLQSTKYFPETFATAQCIWLFEHLLLDSKKITKMKNIAASRSVMISLSGR